MALARKMDLTKGAIPIQLIQFMIPLVLTFTTQILFHLTDVIVVGRFAKNAEHAVAAVGSSSPVTSLLTTLFLGMGAGVSVVVSQYMGAKDYKNVSRAVHSSLVLGLGCGLLILAVSLIFGRTFLELIRVPETIMDDALGYFYVVLWGMPALIVYAFGCAILRSVGKPNLPMFILTASGMTNVILNIIFVTVFGMEVLGVAFATIIAQFLSLFLVLRALRNSHGAYRLWFPKLLRLDLPIMRKVLYNGFPAGVQSSCYSLSNLLVAQANFAFGAGAIAATTIINFFSGGIINSVATAQHQAAITFTGQNVGAKKGKRVLKGFYWNTGYAFLFGITLGSLTYFTMDTWLPWCIKNPGKEVLEYSHIRAALQLLPGMLFMVLDVFSGTLRGLGYSVAPTAISIFGICGFRVLWVFCIFPCFPKNYWALIANYPISYFITLTALGVTLYWVMPKYLQENLQLKKRSAGRIAIK